MMKYMGFRIFDEDELVVKSEKFLRRLQADNYRRGLVVIKDIARLLTLYGDSTSNSCSTASQYSMKFDDLRFSLVSTLDSDNFSYMLRELEVYYGSALVVSHSMFKPGVWLGKVYSEGGIMQKFKATSKSLRDGINAYIKHGFIRENLI